MDRMVRIEVEAVAWERSAPEASERRWLDVPADVDAYNVQSHLEQRFGPPLDTARSVDENGRDMTIGWFFPPSARESLGMGPAGADLLVIPYVSFEDGSRRQLLPYNAELRGRFEDLARSLDMEIEVVDGRRAHVPAVGAAPDERPAPLRDEELALYHSDRDGLTLEIGGWLRRLLAEGHTYLLIEVGAHSRYLQFVTHDGSWLRGEVVGPDYVPDEPLTASELDGIRSAGWYEPEDDPDCRNFWHEWGDPESGEPADVDAAAAMAAATLCDAFGPVDPSAVAVLTGPAHPRGRE